MAFAINVVGTSLTSNDYKLADNPEHAVGTKVVCEDGDVYRYVTWTAAKTEELVYLIGDDWVVGDALSTSNDVQPLALGVFPEAATAPTGTNAYGWIQTGGNFAGIEMLISCAPDVPLYSTATAGKLDDDSSGTKLIEGLKATHAAAGAAAANAAFCIHELTIEN